MDKRGEARRYHWRPRDEQKVYRENPYREVVMSFSLTVKYSVDVLYVS